MEKKNKYILKFTDKMTHTVYFEKTNRKKDFLFYLLEEREP